MNYYEITLHKIEKRLNKVYTKIEKNSNIHSEKRLNKVYKIEEVSKKP